MNKIQWIAVAVVAVAAVIIIAAAVVSEDDTRDRMTLVVETNYDSAPFDYLAGDDLVGIDIDLLRAVCDDMGYDLEFRYKTFDTILDSVQRGDCDIGANTFTINDERKELVLFSDPYITVEQVAVVPIDSDICSAADIKDKRITVKNGTTCADCAETFSDDIIYKKTYMETVQDLLSGKADCEFVNSVIAASQVNNNPGKLKILDDDLGFPSEDFGFVFSKDDSGLRYKFNESLERIRGSGLYDDIMDYYRQNGYSSDTPSFFSDAAVKVGTSPHIPFTYEYGGHFSGIDMDFLEAVDRELGTFSLVKEYAEFSDVFDAIDDGTVDMGVAAVTITDERRNSFLFSDPYMEVRQVVIANLDANYSLEDLKGLTVATQSDTTSMELAKRYGGRVLEFSTYEDAMRAVLDGRADCEITDNLSAHSQTTRNPDLKPLDILDFREEFGFVFSKEGKALCEKVNGALAALKADGSLDNILDYYGKQNYEPTESYYVSDDVIRILTFPLVAPFNYHYGDRVAGIDTDLVKAVADQLGMGRHIVEADSFDRLLERVSSGEFDMGVSEITITDERKELVLFSDRYAEVRQVLVVKADSDFAVSDLSSLTIASQSASTSLKIAKELSDSVLVFNTYEDSLKAVLDGRAECEVTDNYVAQAQIAANPGLKVLDVLDNPESFAFVFPKDAEELRNRVNEALESIRKSGLRDDIFGYYEMNDYAEVESYFDSDEVVTIGTFPHLAPFDYVCDERVAGIDMDILRAVSYEMETSILVRESATFDGVLDGVMNGYYDIGSSGVTITDERLGKYLFSDPYMQVHQILVAEAGADYTVSDLAGLTLATHYNTTSLDTAKKYSKDVLVFATYGEAVEAVLAGKADCAVVDNFSAKTLLSQKTGLKTLDILDDREDFAFMFSKDDTELRDRVNAALKVLKYDGTLDNIFGYYEDNGFLEVESYFDSDRVLKVGTFPNLPPFDYRFEGEITGIDSDILTAVGKELDSDIVMIGNNTFEGVFDGVDTGDYDLGASGITVTAERSENFLFSEPYIEIRQVVVVGADSRDYTVSDLAGLTIATQYNTTCVDVAKKYSDKVVIYQRFDDAIQAMLAGDVDCVIIDEFATQTTMTKVSGLKCLDILDDRESFAFMFSKDSVELRDRMNATLNVLKSKGILEDIFDYYAKHGYGEVGSYFESEDYKSGA